MFYLRQGGCDRYRLSVSHSVCLSVKVLMSQFHWNSVLWLGLPVELLLVLRFRIPDHFSTCLTTAE